MRGSPILHLLVFAAAFGLIAFKVAEYTGKGGYAHAQHEAEPDHGHHEDDDKRQVVEGADSHPEGEHVHVKVPAHILIHFAHPPTRVSLQQEDAELVGLDLDWTQSPVEVEARIEVAHEGNEMFITADWPKGTPDTALTIEIEPNGFDARAQTVWTDEAELDELILFEW